MPSTFFTASGLSATYASSRSRSSTRWRGGSALTSATRVFTWSGDSDLKLYSLISMSKPTTRSSTATLVGPTILIVPSAGSLAPVGRVGDRRPGDNLFLVGPALDLGLVPDRAAVSECHGARPAGVGVGAGRWRRLRRSNRRRYRRFALCASQRARRNEQSQHQDRGDAGRTIWGDAHTNLIMRAGRHRGACPDAPTARTCQLRLPLLPTSSPARR